MCLNENGDLVKHNWSIFFILIFLAITKHKLNVSIFMFNYGQIFIICDDLFIIQIRNSLKIIASVILIKKLAHVFALLIS